MSANIASPAAGQASGPEKPKRVGLELAEAKFGPLLSPIPSTTANWNNYVLNRQKTITETRARGVIPKKDILEEEDDESDADSDVSMQEEDDEPDSDSDEGCSMQEDDDIVVKNIAKRVADIETQLGLEPKTLQKCVQVLGCEALLEEADEPRTVKTLVRFYSPSTPSYIDVHMYYHSRSRYYSFEWAYSIGYKIHTRPSPLPANYVAIARETDSGVQTMHTRNGWRSICWGLYDDAEGNYGRKWHRIEVGEVDLYEDAVLDIYDAIFGRPIDPVEADDTEAEMNRRRKLVGTIQLLFATLGVGYDIACDDKEEDEDYPYRGRGLRYLLEGLSDRWVARGVRKACGFQLQKDPEAERKGKEERLEHSTSSPDDDGEDSESDGSDREAGCPNQ
ncbi:hypothetical protein BJ138DRAFT_1125931 [Hygrophoropsis aurantiaca]|uniref:Uncharacterized protein n=1 Tax=Hygrophoropsis aurantiaca TaxID=72124 RepID=A0ACB8AE31_9AGAM|nr:hypothetical protein BJ138DRAFT_1125931 [Hygrophoropsis aurantiaca]